MDEHQGKHFVSESSLGRLYIYWEEFRGNKFLHIRHWFLDRKDGQWKPGNKGIAIPESKVMDVLGGLRNVLDAEA